MDSVWTIGIDEIVADPKPLLGSFHLVDEMVLHFIRRHCNCR